MKIYNFEQYSHEWWAVRRLKMTASKADTIATAGKGLQTYCLELVAEYFSSATPEVFSNEHTERGHALEEEARQIYQIETGRAVTQCGFVEMNEYAGCSPDGLVGDDGLVELKAYGDKHYTEFLLNDKIESKYLWQMQMQMLVCERSWCDFAVYNPNFKRPIVIIRENIDNDKQEKLKAGLAVGETMLKEMVKTMEGKLKC